MNTATARKVEAHQGPVPGARGACRQAPHPVRCGAVVALLLLSSCGLFRPGAEQQCRRAQGMLARAVRICPEVAQLRTDSLTVHLPGDSSRGAGLWTDADPHAVLEDCDHLRAALDNERRMSNLLRDSSSGIILAQQLAMDSLRRRAAAMPVARLRRNLCSWPDVLDTNAFHILRIRYTQKGPEWSITDKARAATVVHTRLPIVAGPVLVKKSTNGWLVAGTILGWLVAVVLFILLARHQRNVHYN